MTKRAFIHSTELDVGGYPDDCPFNSRRAGMTRKAIASMGLLECSDCTEISPVRTTRDELEMFHSPRYLDAILRAGKGEHNIDALHMGLGSHDCPVFAQMYDYLSLATGGSTTGARLILSGEADIAFNPSGGFHHAAPERASGFCYMNDIVLAALLLTKAGKRVLFVDLDVHHCDGVQNAFYERSDVMTISLHESGKSLFPGTGFEEEIGAGPGRGYTVNIPLPVGTYDDAYYRAFRKAALPIAKAFNPDVIILELGMDALAGDPMAHLHLTNNVYVDAIKDIMDLSKPLLVTGGGGYHVENTVRGWSLAWETLTGQNDDYAAHLTIGGMMLQNTEWTGGLRDRMLISDAGSREDIDQKINDTITKVQQLLFALHGLKAE